MELGVDTFSRELLQGKVLDFSFEEEPQYLNEYPVDDTLKFLHKHLVAFDELEDYSNV